MIKRNNNVLPLNMIDNLRQVLTSFCHGRAVYSPKALDLEYLQKMMHLTDLNKLLI